MTRHEARETAFIILFEKLFRPDDSIDEIVSSAEESDFFQVDDFILSVTGKAGEKQDEIDGMIEKNLVGWTIKRISKVSLAV